MAEIKKVCLDCGKVESHPCPPEEAKTVHGLCEECYQKWLKRDPGLTRWAFEAGEGEKQA